MHRTEHAERQAGALLSRLAALVRAPRCPVCRGSVRSDDAVGVVGGRAAHAECTVFRWLGTPGCERLLGRDPEDARA